MCAHTCASCVRVHACVCFPCMCLCMHVRFLVCMSACACLCVHVLHACASHVHCVCVHCVHVLPLCTRACKHAHMCFLCVRVHMCTRRHACILHVRVRVRGRASPRVAPVWGASTQIADVERWQPETLRPRRPFPRHGEKGHSWVLGGSRREGREAGVPAAPLEAAPPHRPGPAPRGARRWGFLAGSLLPARTAVHLVCLAELGRLQNRKCQTESDTDFRRSRLEAAGQRPVPLHPRPASGLPRPPPQR